MSGVSIWSWYKMDGGKRVRVPGPIKDEGGWIQEYR